MIKLTKINLLILFATGQGVTFAFTTFPAQATRSVSIFTVGAGYVPDGFTAEEWKKKRNEEKKERESKDYQHVGPIRFTSRSLKDFQVALIQGKATHKMPVMFAKEKLKEGKIQEKDIPYMQRNGSWYDGYVPDGFTTEQWMQFKVKEEEKKEHHHFHSRSLASFQKDLEEGKVDHKMPMMYAKEKLKRGMIKPEDVPYMQREDGHSDDSDIYVGYVPEGFTHAQWLKLRDQERNANKSKKLGHWGPTTFHSRSLQSFQEDLNKGKAKHLMPVMFAKEQMRKGKIKPEDVPYMQRGGSWDNSDLERAKTME